MFKLVIVSVLVAVAAAKPGAVILPSAQGDAAAKPEPAPGPQLSAIPYAALPAVAEEKPELPVAQAVASLEEAAGAIDSGASSVAAPRPARAALIASPYLALSQPQPLVYTSYAAPSTALVGEKTITSYGHSIIHGGAPIAQTAYFGPAFAYI